MFQECAPPLPPLVIRIGVTGHRREGLAAADPVQLRARVSEVLQLVGHAAEEVLVQPNSAYTPGAPILRVISPLAEGADRIVAQEALALGFELHCPLPFERSEYERDFRTGESLEEFHALLERASRVFELDGSRETPAREKEAYEAAGRTVLRQCDLLIAVWDGKEPRGKGGTGQIVREAALLGITVIWISSRAPHEIQIRLPDGEAVDLPRPPRHG